MTNYNISHVKNKKQSVWVLKDGNEIIARADTRQSIIKVLAFLLEIKL